MTALTCGTKLKPKIYFSTVGDLEFDLDFIAFSNGRIVDSGTRHVVARNQLDSLESYQNENRIELGASSEEVSVGGNFIETIKLYISREILSVSIETIFSMRS